MSSMEKYHVSVVIITTVVAAIIGGSILIGLSYNVVSGLFGLIGFVALPAFIWRKDMLREWDEMTNEIDRRALLFSFRVILFILIALFIKINFDSSDNISKDTLRMIVWSMFDLLLFVKSAAYLYYLKKGINDEDKK